MKRKIAEEGLHANSSLEIRSSASKRARVDVARSSEAPKNNELPESQTSNIVAPPKRCGRPPKKVDHESTQSPAKSPHECLNFDSTTPSRLPESQISDTVGQPKRGGRPRKKKYSGRHLPREVDRESVQTPTKSQDKCLDVDLTPPSKEVMDEDDDVQAFLVRNSDHSALRKSAGRIIARGVSEDESDDEGVEGEESLARRIWNEDPVEASADEHDSEAEHEGDELDGSEMVSKTKRGRGRPKARKKQPTPSPPHDLPSYEHYFFQNRPGGAKTSNNTLSSLSFLSHETYFEKISAFVDPHEREISFLQELHTRAFEKWLFELEQGFNLCLYGWGSKRDLLEALAAHLNNTNPAPKIIVVNGYISSLTSRDILSSLASAIPSLATSGQKLGSQPADMLNTILAALVSKPPAVPISMLINSIDSHSLRRPVTQAILARLASSPHIRLAATADTPNFPLMWDTTLCAQYRWLYHDVTTFQSFDTELGSKGGGGGVVDEVNALLGRSGRKMQGREGVMYVLKSLTENARSLFSMLIAELLTIDEVDGLDGDNMVGDGDEDDEMTMATPGRRKPNVNAGLTRVGIDFRTLYQKAVSQFIATNETTFRGLLREFYDHEMIVSRKDGLGGEVFGVPFRREEMEAILEELAMDGDV